MERVAAVTETELMLRILDALQRSGTGLYWRNNTGSLKDERGRWVKFGLGLGSPDIVGILAPSGRFVGVEVKRPGEHPTPEQRAWHRAATNAGALIAVVHSVEEALAAVGSAPT